MKWLIVQTMCSRPFAQRPATWDPGKQPVIRLSREYPVKPTDCFSPGLGVSECFTILALCVLTCSFQAMYLDERLTGQYVRDLIHSTDKIKSKQAFFSFVNYISYFLILF